MCILSSPFRRKRLFRSFFDLQPVDQEFVAQSDDVPKPLVWTADPDKIFAAVRRDTKS
jgi:hypothetical protein